MMVICIRDDWLPDYQLQPGSPVRGQVYTVVEEREKWACKFYMLWEGPLHPEGGPTLWLADYFRTCRPTNISSLTNIRVMEPA